MFSFFPPHVLYCSWWLSSSFLLFCVQGKCPRFVLHRMDSVSVTQSLCFIVFKTEFQSAVLNLWNVALSHSTLYSFLPDFESNSILIMISCVFIIAFNTLSENVIHYQFLETNFCGCDTDFSQRLGFCFALWLLLFCDLWHPWNRRYKTSSALRSILGLNQWILHSYNNHEITFRIIYLICKTKRKLINPYDIWCTTFLLLLSCNCNFSVCNVMLFVMWKFSGLRKDISFTAWLAICAWGRDLFLDILRNSFFHSLAEMVNNYIIQTPF